MQGAYVLYVSYMYVCIGLLECVCVCVCIGINAVTVH